MSENTKIQLHFHHHIAEKFANSKRKVRFDALTQDVIDAYVDSGEPTHDKTGYYVKFLSSRKVANFSNPFHTFCVEFFQYSDLELGKLTFSTFCLRSRLFIYVKTFCYAQDFLFTLKNVKFSKLEFK